MSTEENKAAVLRLLDEYVDKRNEAVWDEVVHPDVIIHGVTGELHGTAEAQSCYARMFATFQPWGFTVDDVFAEGNRVVVRITESGTMTGSVMGVPPTGKQCTLSAVQICRLAEATWRRGGAFVTLAR